MEEKPGTFDLKIILNIILRQNSLRYNSSVHSFSFQIFLFIYYISDVPHADIGGGKLMIARI